MRVVCVPISDGRYLAFLEGSDDNRCGIASERDSAVLRLLEQTEAVRVRDLQPRSDSLQPAQPVA